MADAPDKPRLGRAGLERLGVFGPAILLTIVAFVVAFHFVQPAPPRHIVLASGPEDGTYFYYGKIYRDRLAREGIAVTLDVTRGSIENIERLDQGRADIAFVQGGTRIDAGDSTLRSLASLYFEPIWLFVRRDEPIERLADLRGRRVAIDRDGSGTRAIALQLLADTGLDKGAFTAVPRGGVDAAQGLRDGSIDAAFFVMGGRASIVRDLLAVDGVRLFGIERAAAFSLLHPFLSRLTLPEGAMDLAADLPRTDIALLAPAASLVVHDDFHPALAELILRIAREIHGRSGLFEEAGQFPSQKFLEYPLHDAAVRFFDTGPSLLERYLPFWAANPLDRLKIMLLPLITLAYPFFKFVPRAYDWRMRRRINRWYKELQAIERSIALGASRDELARRLAEVEAIERSVQRLSMPIAYGNPLYSLRSHIAMLRDELRAGAERGG